MLYDIHKGDLVKETSYCVRHAPAQRSLCEILESLRMSELVLRKQEEKSLILEALELKQKLKGSVI